MIMIMIIIIEIKRNEDIDKINDVENVDDKIGDVEYIVNKTDGIEDVDNNNRNKINYNAINNKKIIRIRMNE